MRPPSRHSRRIAARPLGTLVVTGFALLLLNAAVTFDNWWPTPAIIPSATLSLASTF